MDNRIQELTDKLYQEGVAKGNQEAQLIIDAARAQESKIVAEAEQKAAAIVAAAEKKSEELKKNTQAELRLFAGQALEGLKTEVTNLVTDRLAKSGVQAAVADKEFMQKMIITLVQEWAKNDQLTLRTADAASLTAYFEANAKALLTKGVKIEQVNGIKTAFEILPADGSYKVSFGADEFVNYFKAFLRPQLVEMLF